MSEFWVSGKKYWCKFCRTFVYDNRACRQNHDSSQKHKDNVKKHLRSLEIKAGKASCSSSKTQVELDRINKSAAKQYAIDTGRNHASQPQLSYQSRMEARLQQEGSSSNNFFQLPPSSEHPQASGEDQASLPKIKIKTPPPVKIRAVLETRIGEWQVVPKSSEESKPAEEPEDENVPFDEDDLSTFRLSEKTYPGSNSNLLDGTNENEQAPVEMSSLFKKRKTTNRATRKK
ncbi:hypothetical protein DSO57_1028518 [Entomophthora muscae]|uniref:Uncharacterized protein n=1 Tax=Entomophthora muscae TaxID=34485 RepID=A0ACC2SEE1_9FUNG|nr:hypothetical protein DSO57_1028518 [Entomophthora muscae]